MATTKKTDLATDWGRQAEALRLLAAGTPAEALPLELRQAHDELEAWDEFLAFVGQGGVTLARRVGSGTCGRCSKDITQENGPGQRTHMGLRCATCVEQVAARRAAWSAHGRAEMAQEQEARDERAQLQERLARALREVA